MCSLRSVPEVLVSSSAVGYYGSRGDEVLTEESAPGVEHVDALREPHDGTHDVLDHDDADAAQVDADILLGVEPAGDEGQDNSRDQKHVLWAEGGGEEERREEGGV